MSDEILSNILTKVTAVGEDVAALKTQVANLVGNGKPGRIDKVEVEVAALIKANLVAGNGQPGRIDKVEADVDALKTAKNYAIGFGAGFAFLEGAYHYLMHRAGLK